MNEQLPPKEWFDTNIHYLLSDYVEARGVEWDEYLASVDKSDGIEDTEEWMAEAYCFALQQRNDFKEFITLKWVEVNEEYYDELHRRAADEETR